MKQFNFHRFINVARWDLTINSKFYLGSSILVIALCCFPILMSNLYFLLSGKYFDSNAVALRDHIEPFVLMICLVGMLYSVIASGYMFHNLRTRQGRINELTLPATNLEKFLWHFLVIAVGTQIVWNIGVVCADLLHGFFRLGFPQTRSMTAPIFMNEFTWKDYGDFTYHGYYIMPLLFILTYCHLRTFSLVNAWKYKHNIPLTVLLHFLLNSFFGLILLVIIATSFMDNPSAFFDFVMTLKGLNPDAVIISLYVFAVLLYCGILYLTYWLYTRAQLITRRNP